MLKIDINRFMPVEISVQKQRRLPGDRTILQKPSIYCAPQSLAKSSSAQDFQAKITSSKDRPRGRCQCLKQSRKEVSCSFDNLRFSTHEVE